MEIIINLAAACKKHNAVTFIMYYDEIFVKVQFKQVIPLIECKIKFISSVQCIVTSFWTMSFGPFILFN